MVRKGINGISSCAKGRYNKNPIIFHLDAIAYLVFTLQEWGWGFHVSGLRDISKVVVKINFVINTKLIFY